MRFYAFYSQLIDMSDLCIIPSTHTPTHPRTYTNKDTQTYTQLCTGGITNSKINSFGIGLVKLTICRECLICAILKSADPMSGSNRTMLMHVCQW